MEIIIVLLLAFFFGILYIGAKVVWLGLKVMLWIGLFIGVLAYLSWLWNS